VYYVCDFFYNN